MTKYFDQFPIIDYNLSGTNGNTKEVTDIFRRVKARSKIQDNVTLFDNYDVAEGEKPEDVAYKMYGEADYLHHYEVTQSSGKQTGDGPADYSHKLEVNSDYPGAQSVSNREYEQREQDKKRQIRVLSPQYLGAFEEEFTKLIRR